MPNGLDSLIEKLSQASKKKSDLQLARRFTSVKTYLNALDTEIRIFVSNSQNFGHQASTVMILRNLIRMGITANYRLVTYAKSSADYKDLDEKLYFLMPQYTGSGRGAPFCLDGVTIATSRLTEKLATQAQLAITGGFDDSEKEIPFDLLNVLNYLQLQPYGWHKGKNMALIYRRGKPVLYDFEEVAAKVNIAWRAFYRPAPTITDWTQFYRAPFSNSVKIVEYLINEVDLKRIELLPVYGIRTEGWVGSNLYNTVVGMLASQNAKPAVLVNIQTLSESDWTKFLTYINGAEDPENRRSNDFTAWHNENNVSTRVIPTGSPNHPALLTEISAVIERLNNNQVLVVYLGVLPQSVFDYLFSKATMPPVIEGQSSVEMMLNIGKPYLKISRDLDNVVFSYPARGAESCLAADIAYNGINGSPSNIWDSTQPTFPPRKLPPMFQAYAGTGAKKLQDYFSNLGSYYHNEINDKLLRALDLLINRIKPSSQKQSVMRTEGDPLQTDSSRITKLYNDFIIAREKGSGKFNLLEVLKSGFIYETLSEIATKGNLSIDAEQPYMPDDNTLIQKGKTADFGLGPVEVSFTFTAVDGDSDLSLDLQFQLDSVTWTLPGADWLTIGVPVIDLFVNANGDIPVWGKVNVAITAGTTIDLVLELPSSPGTFNFTATFEDLVYLSSFNGLAVSTCQ